MSLDVEKILDAARKIDDFAARDEKLMDLLRTLGQAIVDLQEHTQESSPLVIKAIVDGLRELKIAAPPVTITPNLVVEGSANIVQAISEGLQNLRFPAPAITLNPMLQPRERVGWKVRVQSGQFGDPRMDLEMTPFTLPAPVPGQT